MNITMQNKFTVLMTLIMFTILQISIEFSHNHSGISLTSKSDLVTATETAGGKINQSFSPDCIACQFGAIRVITHQVETFQGLKVNTQFAYISETPLFHYIILYPLSNKAPPSPIL